MLSYHFYIVTERNLWWFMICKEHWLNSRHCPILVLSEYSLNWNIFFKIPDRTKSRRISYSKRNHVSVLAEWKKILTRNGISGFELQVRLSFFNFIVQRFQIFQAIQNISRIIVLRNPIQPRDIRLAIRTIVQLLQLVKKYVKSLYGTQTRVFIYNTG